MASWTEKTSGEKRPRVLLVDDTDLLLYVLEAELEDRGFEVVMVHYSDRKVVTDPEIHTMTDEKIVKYALNPANRIDAVLTDLYEGAEYPFGHYLTEALVKSKFSGPILVHSSAPDKRMEDILIKDGAAGLFKKRDWAKVKACLDEQLAPSTGPAI